MDGNGNGNGGLGWGWALACFALGLLLAGLASALWLVVPRSKSVSADFSIPVRTSAVDRGLIGTTYGGVAERLRAERAVVRPIRGGLVFRALDVVWQDPAGPDFVHAVELRGRLDTRALQNRDIVVRGLVAADVDVLLEQDGRREWNYRRALAPLLEGDDDGGRKRIFLVTDISIREAQVRVKTPERAFTIADLAAQLPSANFSGPNLPAPHVVISRATGRLVVRDSSYALVVQNGSATFPTGRADFTAEQLTTGDTRIANLDGSFGGDLPGLGLRLGGRAEHVRFEDIRFVSARVPARGSASFAFAFRPLDDRTNEIRLADARVESGAHYGFRQRYHPDA